MCNCNQNIDDCGCNQIGLESCIQDPCPDGKMDAACVYYEFNKPESSELNCLNISGNTSVKEILERIDLALCEKQITDKDESVKVSSLDTKAGYLNDKITTGDCIHTTVTIDNKLKFELDFTCICNKLKDLNCTGSVQPCTPTASVPVVTANKTSFCGSETVTLFVTNYNGNLQWYKDNVLISGATSNTFTVLSGSGTYFVKNTTVCDNRDSNTVILTYSANCGCSPQPANISISANTTTVVSGGTAILTATGCNGSVTWYNGSGVQIGTGATLTIGIGSYYAKCTTSCGSTTSNTVTITETGGCPTITYNFDKTNPTCNGTTLQSNGTISVSSIVNATQISIDGGSFMNLSSNSIVFTNLSAGTHNLILKSSCSQEAFSITLDSTNCGNNCPTINYNSNIQITQPTCTGNVSNTNGGILLTGLVNVTKVSIANTCSANSFNTALSLNGNTSIALQSLAVGNYCIRLYYDANCYLDINNITLVSNCCNLTVSNPVLSCEGYVLTQTVNCNTSTATVNILNSYPNGYVRYCNGSTFGCSNTCNTPDATLDANGNGTLTNLGVGQTYTIRTYPSNTNCTIYSDQTITTQSC